MKLVFNGLEKPILIQRGRLTTLCVENRSLFARVCQSVLSEEGDRAIEPYSLWGDDGARANSRDAFLMVFNPFELPWTHRLVGGKLYAKFEALFLEDESMRMAIEDINRSLASKVSYYGMSLSSDYCFGDSWSMTKYLKAFSFGVERNEDDSLLDSLIKFLSLIADVECDATLAFVNLKKFLSDSDLKVLVEQVFFLNLPVLLLENEDRSTLIEGEMKTVVDQHFLESFEEEPVRKSASLQEKI